MTPAEEVVRSFWARLAAEDWDGLVELLVPDVVAYGTSGGLDERRVLRGPDEFVAYAREVFETWEQLEVEVERVIEAGDTTVTFHREKGQATRGGPEMTNETATVIKLREGKVAEVRGYLDREEALRVAGIAEAG